MPRTLHPPPRLLVLWDVDHTLIESRGVGRALYERAFPAATGTPLTALASLAGRTELDIMADTLRRIRGDAHRITGHPNPTE